MILQINNNIITLITLIINKRLEEGLKNGEVMAYEVLSFSPAKHAVIGFILSNMTTRLFRESPRMLISPLCSAFRTEAKRIMQIFKLSKMFTVQLHDVRIPQTLRNDLSMIHNSGILLKR